MGSVTNFEACGMASIGTFLVHLEESPSKKDQENKEIAI
jgi:hypothetical protein